MKIKRTQQYYQKLNSKEQCPCSYCLDYHRQIKKSYPKLAQYLAGLGIDYKSLLKPCRWKWINRD